MQIIPEAEKYCKEWYAYVSRTSNHNKLKPRPNDRIDIMCFEKCFVGEARGNQLYECETCKNWSRTLMQDYYYVMHYGYLDDLNEDLTKFFSHLNNKH